MILNVNYIYYINSYFCLEAREKVDQEGMLDGVNIFKSLLLRDELAYSVLRDKIRFF